MKKIDPLLNTDDTLINLMQRGLAKWGWMFFVVLLLCGNCANPVSPRGGPRDQTPPQIDSSRSTPNYAINFTDDRVVLSFDEWVKLNDAFNQIVFSPPFNEPPEVRLTRKKGVMVVFKEALRENTTYTINFGNAIQDITESNPAKDLRFVFSTGSFIDSLEVEGLVTDALTGNASEDVLLMLYENPYDSIVYREKPLYFAKTDNAGRFKIENVKSGTFKIFALVDNNFNYLYDLENESIGFQENDIIVNDSTINRFQVKTFEEETPLRVISKETDLFGQVGLLLNRAVSEPRLTSGMDASETYIQHEEESIRFWYTSRDSGSFDLILEAEDLFDTTTVKLKDRAAFLAGNPRLQVIPKPAKKKSDSRSSSSSRRPSGRTTGKSSGSNASANNTQQFQNAARTLATQSLHPDDPAHLYFSHPVTKVDTSGLVLLEDSLKTTVSIDSVRLRGANREMEVYYPWKEGVAYELMLNADGLEDLFGLTNDSTSVNLKVKERKDYGAILSQLEDLDSTITYIVELYSPSKERLDRYKVSGVSQVKKDYKRLEPGNYEIRVIEDANNNGRWDSGNYAEKRQPEIVLIKTLPPLRANWEVEANVSLNNK